LYNQYYIRGRVPNRPKPKKKLPKYLAGLIIVIAIVLSVVSLLKINGRTVYARLTETSNGALNSQNGDQPTAAQLATLKSTVNSIISNNSDIDFEVSAVDISGGNNRLDFGVSGPMTAASVSKILTAADFLQEVEKGQQTLSETLEDGNTASYDMQQMIVVSDDNAWESLNDQLTYTQIQSYADQIGVNSYQWQNNTLSAYDTANMLAKLWEGKLLNVANTNLILGYMKQANYRQYMVPAIPSYDTIYHKIGLYNDNVNDAAIITGGKQVISLVIFTNGNGTYDWPDRATMMQQITKAFLTYYGLSH
jgi:beta-lactamase class A